METDEDSKNRKCTIKEINAVGGFIIECPGVKILAMPNHIKIIGRSSDISKFIKSEETSGYLPILDDLFHSNDEDTFKRVKSELGLD